MNIFLVNFHLKLPTIDIDLYIIKYNEHEKYIQEINNIQVF